MRKAIILVAVAVLLAGLAFAQGGVTQKRAKPYEFGTVTIYPMTAKAELPPVTFDHWVHRAKYTCRLCHVDIGFAMKKGISEIRAEDNMRGYFCGTCHDGKREYNGKKIFKACSTDSAKPEERQCGRCHQKEKDPARADEFFRFSEKLPKERLGNGINWEKAEADGLIKPIDFLDKVSIKRSPMVVQKDFALETKIGGLPNIVFSHKKHTLWNGCEVCHPEIFAGVKRGATKYSMIDISEGKYCGICHISVAFPLQDCQRCHSTPVAKL
jgi:c(7)-type cytochrome triheme protein